MCYWEVSQISIWNMFLFVKEILCIEYFLRSYVITVIRLLMEQEKLEEISL